MSDFQDIPGDISLDENYFNNDVNQFFDSYEESSSDSESDCESEYDFECDEDFSIKLDKNPNPQNCTPFNFEFALNEKEWSKIKPILKVSKKDCL